MSCGQTSPSPQTRIEQLLPEADGLAQMALLVPLLYCSHLDRIRAHISTQRLLDNENQ